MSERENPKSIVKALGTIGDLLPPKPPDSARQSEKKRSSELLSAKLAIVFADELRGRGLHETLPIGSADPDVVRGSERRMAGGIGAKKVDVTWATEESGLLLAISIKTINFRDKRSQNYQKNLINRRGDMLMEAVTLHRRFPYAVLAGLMFLDIGAARDATGKRRSTFDNAHTRLRLFTGRDDPAGRDEQFEKMCLALIDLDGDRREAGESVVAESNRPFRFYEVGRGETEIEPAKLVDQLLQLVAERNPDLYEYDEGRLVKQ